MTQSGGPNPVRELERMARVAEVNRDGLNWIASRKRGVGFEGAADYQLLASARGMEDGDAGADEAHSRPARPAALGPRW